MKQAIQTEAGQSLMEVMVAIGILMSGAIAIYGLVLSSIRGGSFSRNELIATQLSKEGIEVVRAFRDANALYNQSHPTDRRVWDEGFDAEEFLIASFSRANYEDPDLRQPLWNFIRVANGDGCVNSGRCRLYWDPVHGLYTHESSNARATSFYRFLQLEEICEDHQIMSGGATCADGGKTKVGRQVISEVRWTEQTNARNFRIEEHLYDWKL